MKLRAQRAGSNRKHEERAHWTANVARYTMRESDDAHDTPEDLRDAIARSSGLSSQETKAA
jgi:protein subunit release factor B